MALEDSEESISLPVLIHSRNLKMLAQVAAEQGRHSKKYRILLAIHAVDPEIPLVEAQAWLAAQSRIPDDDVAAAELFFQKRPLETELDEMVHVYRQETLDWLREAPMAGFSDEEWRSVINDLQEIEELIIARLRRFSQNKKNR